jgi:hypothetical protein
MDLGKRIVSEEAYNGWHAKQRRVVVLPLPVCDGAGVYGEKLGGLFL